MLPGSRAGKMLPGSRAGEMLPGSRVSDLPFAVPGWLLLAVATQPYLRGGARNRARGDRSSRSSRSSTSPSGQTVTIYPTYLKRASPLNSVVVGLLKPTGASSASASTASSTGGSSAIEQSSAPATARITAVDTGRSPDQSPVGCSCVIASYETYQVTVCSGQQGLKNTFHIEAVRDVTVGAEYASSRRLVSCRHSNTSWRGTVACPQGARFQNL